MDRAAMRLGLALLLAGLVAAPLVVKRFDRAAAVGATDEAALETYGLRLTESASAAG